MSGSPRSVTRAGFTLIEVILAVGLTVGLMLVVLYFYQQASRLREEVLGQLDTVSAVRLLQERLTQELRCARSEPFLLLGLRGQSNSLEFVYASWPQPKAWTVEDPLMAAASGSDLKIVRYELAFESESTNATGILRSEEGLLELPPRPEDGTEQQALPPGEELLTDQLRFLQLRYWSGTNWVDSWSELRLPSGVEVSLARHAPEVESEAELGESELVSPVFRRVIFLPGSEYVPELGQPNDLSFDGEGEEGLQAGDEVAPAGEEGP